MSEAYLYEIKSKLGLTRIIARNDKAAEKATKIALNITTLKGVTIRRVKKIDNFDEILRSLRQGS